MWYLDILKRGWERFARQLVMEKKAVHQALGKQLSGLNVTEDLVKECIAKLGLPDERCDKWTEEQLFSLARLLRQKSKPMITACNKADIPGAYENFNRVKAAYPNELFVATSAEMELALREAAKHELIDYIPGDSTFTIKHPEKLNDAQRKALDTIAQFLKAHGSTGVQQACNTAVFDLLHYIAVSPGGVGNLVDKHGNTLPDCFLVRQGSTALDFAYKLHTQLGDGFIRAIDVKTKRTVGKEHLVKHLDVFEIVSNA